MIRKLLFSLLALLSLCCAVNAQMPNVGPNGVPNTPPGLMTSSGTVGDTVSVGPEPNQIQDSSFALPLTTPVQATNIVSSLSGWGSTATANYISADGFSSTNAPVMGSFSTPSGQASYFGRDHVGSVGGIFDANLTTTVGVSSFTTTTVTLSSSVPCSSIRARSGNVAGTLISTNDTPKFSGEVTGFTCSAGTTSVLTVSGWFQVIGAKIATATVVGGGTGCTNGSQTFNVGNSGGPNGGHYDFQGMITGTVASNALSGALTVTYAGSYNQAYEPINPVPLVGAGCATNPTATLTWTNVAANTSAGQTPVGTSVKINPANQVFAQNFVCDFYGTGDAKACHGYELDIDNRSGIDEVSSPGFPLLRGLDIVNLGTNKIGSQIILRGPSNFGLTIGDGLSAVGSQGQILLYPQSGNSTIASVSNTIDFLTGNDFTSTHGQFEIGFVASAVNRVQVVGAPTTAAPAIQPVGTDSAISLLLSSKGAATVLVRPGTDNTAAFKVQHAGGGNVPLQVDTTNDTVLAQYKLQVGSLTALTMVQGEIGLNKIAASGSAPGAAGGKFELVCGTNAGSAKLIAYAGTSTTAATILDNIGSGVTGC